MRTSVSGIFVKIYQNCDNCQRDFAISLRCSELLLRGPENPWRTLLEELLCAWREETDNARLPAGSVVEFLYEALLQRRQESCIGDGVSLGTVHVAKGMEFRHVVIPATGWYRGRRNGAERPADQERRSEEERRVFYVGITRAGETLTILDRKDEEHPFLSRVRGDSVFLRDAPRVDLPSPEVLLRRYGVLSMEDLFLDLAGRQDGNARIHADLARLEPGHALRLVSGEDHVWLQNSDGRAVASLSRSARQRWESAIDRIEEVRILAMIARRRRDCGSEFVDRIKADTWEVPVCEVVHRPLPGEDE
jgi:ATP-dependent DNA helicase RecQ